MAKGHVGKAARAIAAVSMLVAGAGAAQAHDDAGVTGFFQQLFGGGQANTIQQPLSQPSYVEEDRPLTVRPHQRHRRPTGSGAVASARPLSKDELAALKNVTMYTDKTLRPGDAVMTTNGMKIFDGDRGDSHTDADFVAITGYKRVAPAVRKELSAMDIASRF